MIVILVTGSHDYTHQALKGAGQFDLRIVSYHRLLRSSRRLRRATYIFCDLDRLNFWELELAGRVYRRLAEAGVRVLNDPARVRQRYSLLRTLQAHGMNRFNVWRVEDPARPDRFPVFLRTESAHRGPLSDLLHDEDQVQTAVDQAVARGQSLRDMLLVEYCAEPVREGLYRKHAIYRVGERLVPALSVHDAGWRAKRGQLGIAGQELYEEEHEMVTTNRYSDALRPAFEAGDIDYGRADFGMVGGSPQIYEINTNPSIAKPGSHPFPIRVEAGRLAFRQLVEAFEAIDTPGGAAVKIDDKFLSRQRRYDRFMTHPRWMP